MVEEVVLLVRVVVGQEGEVHPVRVGEEEEEDQGQVEEEEEEAFLLRGEEEGEELELGEVEEQEQWWLVETLAEPDSWDKAAVSQSCVSCTPLSDLRPWTSVCGETCVDWAPAEDGRSLTCSPSGSLCAPESPPCPR